MKLPLKNIFYRPGNEETVKPIFVALIILTLAGCAPTLLGSVKRGDSTRVLAMLERGAEVNVKNGDGNTALHEATLHGHYEVVRTLLEAGADPNIQDNAGNSPLHEAAQKNRVDIAHLLIESGADLSAKDRFGNSPLHKVVSKGHFELALLLIESKADVNEKDKVGITPLHWATSLNDRKLVRLLIEKGADLNGKNNRGYTPLHWAAYHGAADIIPDLINAGAGINERNNDGKTPLQIAQEKGIMKAANILMEAEVQRRAMGGEGEIHLSDAEAQMGSVSTKKRKSVRSDVDELPKFRAGKKKGLYAIVVGIEEYREKLPSVDFATSDARLVTKYLTRVMGYPEENIVTLLNEKAAKSDLEKYFEKWLPNNAEKDGTVLIYYSGHGSPNPKSGDAYLVPFDGDPTFIHETGFSLKRLYRNLEKLPVKEVIVMLDSCFSGAGGRSVLAKGARPLVVKLKNELGMNKKTVVLSASSGNQISSTYDKKGHGLFTYFMLKGLKGEADANRDGKLEITELFDFIKPNITRTARKLYNNEQSPQIIAPRGQKVVLIEGLKIN
jgi:ankyrin repeat protein